MTTPIYQSLGELSLGPDMAHTQAGRRGQNARVISAPSIPRDPELYYDLEKTASRHGTTTNVEESIDSKALAFKRLERQPGREGFTFSGREDFTVHFRNRKKKSLWCDCANAAPCSVSPFNYSMSSQYSNTILLAHILRVEPTSQAKLPPAANRSKLGHSIH